MNGKPMDLTHHVLKAKEKEEDKIPQLGVADLFDSQLWKITVGLILIMINDYKFLKGCNEFPMADCDNGLLRLGSLCHPAWRRHLHNFYLGGSH